MNIKVYPSQVHGSIKAPASKSYTHRVLFCSALANGRSIVRNPLLCSDVYATINALRSVGVEVYVNNESIIVDGGELTQPQNPINCIESGTTMRFTVGLCSLINGKSIVTGSKSLLRRPIKPLVDALNVLGAKCTCINGLPPITVEGVLKGGSVLVDSSLSSQFISSIMIAAPKSSIGVEIRSIVEPVSKPYILITLDVMNSFNVSVKYSNDFKFISVERQNYTPKDFTVEGDWSSAAILLVLGVVGGMVTVQGLNMNSFQGDKSIVDLLKLINIPIEIGNNYVSVTKHLIKPFEFNISDTPDLFPILCVLSACSIGTCRLYGVNRLRFKESDRVVAMADGLMKMGVNVALSSDYIAIKGGRVMGGVTIDSYNDHRIAMAFTVLATIADNPIIIKNAECVSKSYPSFWDDVRRLGVKFEVV
ncbi:MAG: 3-phosphoshikimate 1-carboxyvinyltransferase [Candidatus Methanomethylicia archaeon]